jgi:hypothetical protein
MTICTYGMEAWTVSGECAGCSHMNKRNQQMTKAPERIWAWDHGWSDHEMRHGDVLYIRAASTITQHQPRIAPQQRQ